MFIVFEGVDGAGKSTHARLLADWLRQEKKQQVYLTAEPTKSRLGYSIRQLIENSEDWKPPEYLAYLLATNRYQHLYKPNGILANLKQGKIVICDRYFYSSQVYQSSCSSLVRELNKNFPEPDLLIYLEPAHLSYDMRMVSEKYKNLSNFHPNLSCYDIDKTSLESNQDKIREFVSKWLHCS